MRLQLYLSHLVDFALWPSTNGSYATAPSAVPAKAVSIPIFIGFDPRLGRWLFCGAQSGPETVLLCQYHFTSVPYCCVVNIVSAICATREIH